MLNRLRSLLFSSVLGLAALALGGCGGDSGGTTGPASSSAFAGTSISFNPTINFTNGTDLTYLNNEVGSPFPAAAVATAGTYVYVPNASFTAGTLTLTVDGIPSPIVLEIGSFTQTGGNVTGFSIRYNGQSYPATVTGTLAAYQKPSGGGGAGESRASDIPSSLQGTYDLVFFISETTPIAGVPADGTQTNFVISARTLKVGTKTLSNPVFYNGNDLEWLFKDGSLVYAVSISPVGGLNEINIYGAIGASGPNGFYGQYREAVAVTLSGGKLASGTFTGSVNSAFSPAGFPASAAYAANDTETFTFGTDTVTMDGNTYTFDAGQSDAYFHVYTATIEGNAELIRVGISSAGGSDYLSSFTLERNRPGEAPITGTVRGSYFFRVVP